jgi:anti-sigma B factor antagonist
VTVEGELDLHTAPELDRAVQVALAEEPASLVVDLVACPFIDSTALGVLIRARERLDHGSETRIAVATADPNVRKVFEITSLDTIFPLYPTRAAALEAVAGVGAGHGG